MNRKMIALSTKHMMPVMAGALMLAAFTGCRDAGSTPQLPRREAYVRINPYPAEYTATSLPVHFVVNSHALIATSRKDDGTYWLTASYPRYGATLYCTFTPVSDREEKIRNVENRLERMQLNIADTRIDSEETTGPDFSATLVTTPSASATPVQFLIYPAAGSGWVVSGATFFPGIKPGASTDSVAPMIKAIEADVREAISQFHF